MKPDRNGTLIINGLWAGNLLWDLGLRASAC